MGLDERVREIYARNKSAENQPLRHEALRPLEIMENRPGFSVPIDGIKATIPAGAAFKVPLAVWKRTPALMSASWSEQITKEQWDALAPMELTGQAAADLGELEAFTAWMSYEFLSVKEVRKYGSSLEAAKALLLDARAALSGQRLEETAKAEILNQVQDDVKAKPKSKAKPK
jgi:hypothetical protein